MTKSSYFYFKRKKACYIFLMFLIFLMMFNVVLVTAFFPGETRVDDEGNLTLSSNQEDGSMEGAWNHFIRQYKNFITGLSGIGALTMLLFFIINFSKLGTHASNPNERQRIIGTLIFTGVSTACLGALSLIVGIFYGVF